MATAISELRIGPIGDLGGVGLGLRENVDKTNELVRSVNDLAAVELNWDAISGKPSVFPPAAHKTRWADILNKPDLATALEASKIIGDLDDHIARTTDVHGIEDTANLLTLLAGDTRYGQLAVANAWAEAQQFNDPTVPFSVQPGTARVDDLDVEFLDGQDSAFYRNAGNLNAGLVPLARGGLGIDGTFQLQNRVVASPDGGPGALSVRALVPADIPNLDVAKLTSGILGLARGGLGIDGTSQLPNKFFGSPDGVAGALALRALLAADIPSLDTSKLTTGTLSLARGGFAQDSSSIAINRVWASPGSGAAGAPSYRALVLLDIPNLSSLYDVLGSAAAAEANANSYTDLVVASTSVEDLPTNAALGSIFYTPGSNDVAALAPGAVGTVLVGTGGNPAYQQVGNAHVSNTAAIAFSKLSGVAALVHTHSAADVTSGLLALARGGLNVDASSQLQNRVFASPDGSTGAMSVRALVAADIPNLDAAKITTGTLAKAQQHAQTMYLDTVTNTITGNTVNLQPSSGASATMLLQRTGGAGWQVQAQATSATFLSVGAFPLRLGSNSTIRWDVVSAGHYQPAADATYDLGATSFRPRDLLLSRDATVGRNLVLNGTASLGGGVGVVFHGNATTNPTSNPVGGGLMYADGGAGKWRGSGGTTTTFGPADPHCPVCDSDFGMEWDSPKYGYLSVCILCLIKEIGNRPWIRHRPPLLKAA